MNVLDLIFPKACLGCGKEGKYICSDCLLKVKIAKPICPYCEKGSIDGFTHIKCAKSLGLDGLTAVWEYEGVVRKAILSLKYKYSTEVGKEITDNFIRELLTRLDVMRGSILVPIPLYWYRENTRGFNQSVEVGKTVALEMGWKFDPDILIRKKPTTPQVELSRDERHKNLKGVFMLNPHHTQFIDHQSLIIFDDVFTTGSTLREAAKVLKRAGVEKVWGLTIAR